MTTANRNETIVLEVEGRFYVGKSQTGRLQTAWSLAGAKHFGPWMEHEIVIAEAFIAKKGRQAARRLTTLTTLSALPQCGARRG